MRSSRSLSAPSRRALIAAGLLGVTSSLLPLPVAAQCLSGGRRTVFDRRYGDASPDQVFDVHYPPDAGCDGGPYPVIFFIHGGGFTSGIKRGQRYATKIAMAARLGCALVSIGYRLQPASRRTPGAPAPVCADAPLESGAASCLDEQLEDAIAAMIEAASPDLGLDMRRCVTMGHSAGTYFATKLAVCPWIRELVDGHGVTVRGFVGIDGGGYDLEAMPSSQRTAGFTGVLPPSGDGPGTRGALSPMVDVVAEPAPPPPMMLVVRSGYVPNERITRSMRDLAVAKRGEVDFMIMPDTVSHNDIDRFTGDQAAPYTEMTARLETFLARHLR